MLVNISPKRQSSIKNPLNMGILNAYLNLGNLYARGDGVKKDTKLARRLYVKAVEQNVVGAKEILQKLD